MQTVCKTWVFRLSSKTHIPVLSLGKYRFETPGGYGAVREICDLVEYVLRGRSR